jgi:hypothetical protein
MPPVAAVGPLWTDGDFIPDGMSGLPASGG